MNDLRVVIHQTAPRLEEVAENEEELRRRVGDSMGADLLVFPELALTGYSLRTRVQRLAVPIGDSSPVALPDASPPLAMGLAERLAAMPTLPIRMLKESIDAAIASDLEATLNREAAYQGMCHLTDDMREGVQAMMEKRPPRFKDEY